MAYDGSITGKIIHTHMFKLGYTPKKLSDRTGIELEKIQQYLQGNCKDMIVSEMSIFCNLFNITMDEFIGTNNVERYEFYFGDEKFESSTNIYPTACVMFVQHLIKKGLVIEKEIIKTEGD